MAKKLIEMYDTFPVSFKVSNPNKDVMFKDSSDSVKTGYSLICEVNATHAGTLINNRIYPPDAMKKGIRSWTSPYKKPVLTNHDDTKDPIGRVISGKYLQTERGISDKDWKPILRESEGYGYQRLTVKITDPEAIKKILDGRYQTVSVRMSTDHCTCSICGSDWSGGDGPCEHTPGSKYEGKLAYMTTGDLSYRELSFVNIPADEYAGVKEAIIADQKNTAEINLYANNDKDKVLSDLESGINLYSMLDAEAEESDNVVAYLLDKSSKATIINKEEDVKLTDLTKDQLKDLSPVKELVNEALDKAKKECEGMVKECEAKVGKMKEEHDSLMEDAKKKAEESKNEKMLKKANKEQEEGAEEEKEEDEDAKKMSKKKENDEDEDEDGKKKMKKKDEDGDEDEDEDAKKKKKEEDEDEDEDAKKAKKKDEDEEEEEEEDEDGKKAKTKKGSPVPKILPENKGKGKSGGVKHGAGNLSPVQEDPQEYGSDSDDLSSKVKELEDNSKKMLDENVKINSELHRMVAERLYDLKKSLRKPDVISVLTPDARDKKVEEFAQRSVDSLKDQIKDLLIEQENALTAGSDGSIAENPAISQDDLTNEVLSDKKKVREGKQDTLTRLFPKSA